MPLFSKLGGGVEGNRFFAPMADLGDEKARVKGKALRILWPEAY